MHTEIRRRYEFHLRKDGTRENHKKELKKDWELAKSFQPLEKIKGADND